MHQKVLEGAHSHFFGIAIHFLFEYHHLLADVQYVDLGPFFFDPVCVLESPRDGKRRPTGSVKFLTYLRKQITGCFR